MRFLIDGYNLLHGLGLARPRGPGQLERSRATMLEWLARTHQGEAGSVTVVFDGRENAAGSPNNYRDHGIRVVFSVGRIADDLIEELIASDRSPRGLTVVSSDRRIQEAARRRQCAFWSCDEYIERSVMNGHDLPKPPEPPDKPETMSPEETERWKKEFADLDNDPELRKFNQPFKDFFED